MFDDNLRLLIVEDDHEISTKLNSYFQKQDFEVAIASTFEQASKVLFEEEINICFLDVILPDGNGLDLLKRIKVEKPAIEVILMSGYGTMDIVIEGLRYGALDFIKKPFNFYDIDYAISRTRRYMATQEKLINTENRYSLIGLELENSSERKMIGKSSMIKKVIDMAMLAGQDRDINVLITGENGTGKEIVARIIHYSSARKDQPFFPVNSAAIPESLLESEFFGHRKGSFTDAREDKKGLFERTNGGTLFLDEIADMPLSLQSKLLRAIEEKNIKPVGGEKFINVDLRIISATNRNIGQMIEDNKFRRDFYHRINTFIIHIPALRERPEDIEPLLNYFVAHFAKQKNRPLPEINPEIIKKLKSYPFPGNVRELKNMVERAFLISRQSRLELSDFLIPEGMKISELKSGINLNLAENEKRIIQNALSLANLDQQLAANYLGISRVSLYRRLKKHQITIDRIIK
jgi:DNA-binding NtrC family response regulator